MLLWVVVPAFNEAPNLRDLVPRTLAVLAGLPGETRLLLVDDGSSDGTAQVMRALAAEHAGVEVEILRHNRGKAAALREGFERACEAGADVVAMMDADGQDDPAELPRLLARLGEGADLVTGARLERNDRFVKRTTSRLYNAVTRRFSGTPGRDFNSGLKLMRREVALDALPMLYGEMHRYLTVVAHAQGHRVDEVPVRHHRRMSGTSKYGPSRFWRGFADLVTVRFLLAYENRPSHLFGAIGGLCLLLGGALLAYLTGLKAITGAVIGDRPLLLAGVLLVMVGLQLLLFGLLAELVVHARQTGQRRGVEPGDAQLRRVVAGPAVGAASAPGTPAALAPAPGRVPAPGVHG